jgi:ABC-type antimicrobial peptide transport system permease subunit
MPSTATLPRPQNHTVVPSTVTLALWRVRRTWRLLLIAGIGILAAVILVCAVPLYSEVSMTAGLRGILNATPQDSVLTVQGTGQVLTPPIAQQETQRVNSLMQQRLGTYLQKQTEFSLQTPQLNISSPTVDLGMTASLVGADMQEATPHVQVVSGRLPKPETSTLEIAITQKTAGYLHVDVGSPLTLDLFFYGPSNPLYVAVQARVVGIIVATAGDPYWHNQTFEPIQRGPTAPPTQFVALMSNDSFLQFLQDAANAQSHPTGMPFTDGLQPTLFWYYSLNVASINVNQLDDLIALLHSTQAQIGSGNLGGSLSIPDAVNHTQLSGPALDTPQTTSTLDRFHSRVSLVNIPVTILLLQVVGLILFFVGMMTGLLVERQAEVIALLRSRGASSRQVFGSFVTQSFGLALVAMIAGPLLAIVAVQIIAQMTLNASDQQALNVVTANPVRAALGVGWFAAAAAFSAVVAMFFSIRGLASRDVLEMRRESARATRQPLWQRMYLDVVAAVIALTGFGLSLYVTNSGALDAQTSLLIAAPLALVAPIFLVIAGTLLFLRFFPLFLRFIAWLVTRRAGAAPMLALAQMARAPRQAVRMILLLALASSFASFALVFNASETEHIRSMAAFEAGADFSGPIRGINYTDSLAKQTATYRSISGVTSASLGYAGDATPESAAYQATSFSVRAVDPSTFAQAAIWTTQDSRQSLASLMRQLNAARPSAMAQQLVPAFTDALTWQSLNLSVGSTFVLQVGLKNIIFQALGEVQHIPTVNDSLVSSKTSDYSAPGGILADVQALISAYNASSGDFIGPNYAWLSTSDDPAKLAKIRGVLNEGKLSLNSLNDRRAIIAGLEKDPLYLALLIVLTLGTATTVLLALLGNLTASWLNARSRLINFAVLRALGTMPRQIASVLTWEQTIIYATAIALGAIFGAILAVAIVPSLVFTGVPTYTVDISSGEFYALQHLLPVEIVVPLLLIGVFVALVLICVFAIVMMARVVSSPSLSQTLRLNAD